MIALNIIWPVFAMVLLIFVVWTTMVVQRLGHMRRQPPDAATFASGSTARSYFEPVDLAANNLANLFEMPVLFFAVVAFLMLTQQVNPTQVVLAWLFVLTRATHSVVHVGANNIRARFGIYLVSVIILAVMWIGFLYDMVAAAHAYHVAMEAVRAAPQP